MKTLAELITQWAIADGASKPEVEIKNEGRTCQYGFSANMDGQDYQLFIDGIEADRLIIFSIYHSEDCIPRARAMTVAQLLSMINDKHISIGNFELFSNQRVRYRDAMTTVGDTLEHERMQAVIDRGLNAFEHVLPMVRKVAFAGFSAEAVMANPEEVDEFIATARVENDGTPSWQEFPGSDVIQHWAASVRTALAKDEALDAEAWRLIGPAIAIEHSFLRIGESLSRCIATDCGIPLHVVEAENLLALKDNLHAFEAVAPVLVYLEAGAWQNRKEDDRDADDLNARAQVQALLRAFNPARPVFVMTVTQSMEDFALPLRRLGAFDRWFELPPITPLAAGELFLDFVGRERCAPSLTASPAKVGKLLDRNFDAPEVRRLAALCMQRMHAETNRPIEFIDLVDMDTQGLAESDSTRIENETLRVRAAWHEAGHATMALLNSNGQDMPEFTSIVPHGNSIGVVVNSVEYSHARAGQYSYVDMCHFIRVSLAGRAAEEVAYGPSGISNGCRTDLANSFHLATDAFASWGFAPGMDDDVPSESNLAVILGTPTPSEYAHVEGLVRNFLAVQYRLVRDQLMANRPLLDAIQARLMETAILDQQEMAQIYQSGAQP